MCSSYTITKETAELARLFEADLTSMFSWKPRIFPKYEAPVFILKNGKKILEPRHFGLIPSWMKDDDAKKIKWNYNAREDKITFSKWWKDPLSSRRCLVPISKFFESIDTGEYGGYMVSFEQENKNIFLAAGLYDEWISEDKSKTLKTFTILTGPPPPFVEKVGHDRCPLFPSPTIYEHWLSEKKGDPQKIREYLMSNLLNSQVEFTVEKDRLKKTAPK